LLSQDFFLLGFFTHRHIMARQIVVGAAWVAAVASLHGCGGGSGGGGGETPSSSPDKTTAEPNPDDPSSSPVTAVPDVPTTTTTTPAPPPPPPSPCVALPPKPPLPAEVQDLNGFAYPAACYELKDENHFFVIGDWGGMCGWGLGNDKCGTDAVWADDWGQHSSMEVRPMKNRGQHIQGIDDSAQQRIAVAMGNIAEQTPPEFVVSVGDHFYPGGIAEHADGRSSSVDLTTIPNQFQHAFENIYNSTHMADKEWMGVLGNHDYGGVCVNMGWPQQVFYTWNEVSKRWVLPAQYYSRNLRFSKGGSDDWDEEDFTIDMFFLDSNFADVHKGSDEKHDMCCKRGNTDKAFPDDTRGYHCGGFLGEDDSGEIAGSLGLWTSAETCDSVFHQLWADQLVWLEDLLDKSTADWQMLVTHFPPNYNTLGALVPLVEKYGVDLIMAGHSHMQMVRYQEEYIGYDIGDTAWVISGGGGGVTSEGPPVEDYSGRLPQHDRATGNDDQYGFMDMAITKDHLSIKPYSWGKNQEGSHIIRRGAEVSRRPRADGNDFRPVKPKTVVV